MLLKIPTGPKKGHRGTVATAAVDLCFADGQGCWHSTGPGITEATLEWDGHIYNQKEVLETWYDII